MRKNIAMICVTLAAVIAAQGCINHEIRLDSFEELCIASGGEVENSLQCKCPQSEIVCSVGTVCNNMGECLGIELDGTSCKDSDNKICSNGVIYDCKFEQEKYIWREFDTCPSGICNETGDACLAICKEGNTKCDYISESEVEFAVISTCIGGRWDYDNSERCSQNVSCTLDNSKTNGDAEDIQDNSGNWKCGECKNDEIKCEDGMEYGKLFKCSNGLWEENNICKSNESNASCTTNDVGKSVCGYCRNGDTKCETGKEFICQNGQWSEISICLNNVSCTNDDFGQSKCGICSDGSFKCMNNTSQICKNGQWEIFENCTVSCDSNNELCIGCIDGDTLCVNGKFKVCENGIWGEFQECMNGASCQDIKQCGICQNNETICQNGKKYTCNSGTWGEDVQNCENNVSCTVNEAGQSMCGICSDGTFKCINNTSQICKNGTWEFFETCDSSCNNALGVCADCVENDAVCVNMIADDKYNGYLRVCKDHQWQEFISCSTNTENTKLCLDEHQCGVCVEDEIKCENGNFSICLAGKWVTEKCSNGLGCKDNLSCKECDDKIMYQCKNDKTPAICNNGVWQELEKCDLFCDKGNCVKTDCTTDGDSTCKNDEMGVGSLYVCEDNLYKTEYCPNQYSCKPSHTMAKEFVCGDCLNGDKKCQNGPGQTGKLKVCENGEWKEEDCLNQYSCKLLDDEHTVCGDCKNGAQKCECDGSSCGEYKCNDGMWKLSQLCGGSSCKDSTTCGSCLDGAVRCVQNDEKIGAQQTCIGGNWTESAQVCTGNHIIEATKVSFVEENITVLTNMPQSCAVDNKSCGSCLNDDVICHEINGKAYTFICKNGAYQVQKQCDKNRCSDDHKDCRQCDEEVDLKVCINNASFAGSTTECINGKSVTKDCLSGYSCKNDSDCGECVNNKTLDVSTSSNDCTLQYCVNGQKHVETKSGVSCSVSSDGTLIFGECITDSRKCEYGPNGEAYSVLCKNGIWGTPVKCASYCSEEDHKCH